MNGTKRGKPVDDRPMSELVNEMLGGGITDEIDEMAKELDIATAKKEMSVAWRALGQSILDCDKSSARVNALALVDMLRRYQGLAVSVKVCEEIQGFFKAIAVAFDDRVPLDARGQATVQVETWMASGKPPQGFPVKEFSALVRS